MAYLDDEEGPREALDVELQKMSILKDVADVRDRIIDENIDTPQKIVIGAMIGVWAIWYFLIKR